MADTSNLTNFLGDIADAIRTKKGTTTQIPAENFDQEILSIEGGTDIRDATATVNDVLQGEIFYNNNGRQEGAIETEYGEVKLITMTPATKYYIFDFLPELNVGIIGTSSTASSVMVARFNQEIQDFDISDAYTIPTPAGLRNIISCKFGGKPIIDNEYYILVNGNNAGSYDAHYFQTYRINLDTLEVKANYNSIYGHEWWTTGEAIYNITANPAKSNEFYMMLVNSYRMGEHGCIKVVTGDNSTTFSEQNTGGVKNPRKQCLVSIF